MCILGTYIHMFDIYNGMFDIYNGYTCIYHILIYCQIYRCAEGEKSFVKEERLVRIDLSSTAATDHQSGQLQQQQQQQQRQQQQRCHKHRCAIGLLIADARTLRALAYTAAVTADYEHHTLSHKRVYTVHIHTHAHKIYTYVYVQLLTCTYQVDIKIYRYRYICIDASELAYIG